MKSEIKIPLILGIVIIIVVVAFSMFLSSLDSQVLKSKDESIQSNIVTSTNKIDKSGFKKAPELTGLSGYINTLPDELQKKIHNSVVLYDFWTYSCINCIRTLPFITAWDEKYSDQGLLIIGIHAPEFEFEKNIDNVKVAVEKYGIHYPVVLDNDHKTWDAFDNRYWPRKYIADNEGFIRYDHIGEGAYDETEKVIQNLLKERADSIGTNVPVTGDLVKINQFEHSWIRTPELYFGFDFKSGRNQLGNSEGFVPNQDVVYSIPSSLNRNYFYLDGTWTNLEGSMKLVSDSGRIVLPYSGKEVNIVTAGDATLQINIDGVPITPSMYGNDVKNGQVHVHDPGLYNVIKTDISGDHTIEILVKNPGFEIFTFTFG